MGRGSTGAKAGVVAGIAYGILGAIFTLVILIVDKSAIIAALDAYASTLSSLGLKTSGSALYSTELLTAPVGAVIEGIVGGIILGAIFGLAVHKIPGRNDKVKGMVFGFILWFIFTVLMGLFSRTEFGNTYYLLTVLTGLVSVVVYGYILGALFGKWWGEPSSQVQTESFNVNQ
ncbi:MAG: DUF6789 family protein [Thermoplasmataceae archaeon]